jgi:DNA invertase Pin-like site-specific DNA recombinase
VHLVVLDQGIDTSTAVGRLFFSIIGAIAEFEHALISERTIDGLSAARTPRPHRGTETQTRTTPGEAGPADV